VPEDAEGVQAYDAEGNPIEVDPTKTVIKCVAMKRQDLNDDETIDMRIFYWAAYNGLDRYLRLMVENRKWSPYIKSFRNRSILSAAVWGSQVNTVRILLGDYTYQPGVARDDIVDLSKTIFNKDD